MSFEEQSFPVKTSANQCGEQYYVHCVFHPLIDSMTEQYQNIHSQKNHLYIRQHDKKLTMDVYYD